MNQLVRYSILANELINLVLMFHVITEGVKYLGETKMGVVQSEFLRMAAQPPLLNN